MRSTSRGLTRHRGTATAEQSQHVSDRAGTAVRAGLARRQATARQCLPLVVLAEHQGPSKLTQTRFLRAIHQQKYYKIAMNRDSRSGVIAGFARWCERELVSQNSTAKPTVSCLQLQFVWRWVVSFFFYLYSFRSFFLFGFLIQEAERRPPEAQKGKKSVDRIRCKKEKKEIRA